MMKRGTAEEPNSNGKRPRQDDEDRDAEIRKFIEEARKTREHARKERTEEEKARRSFEIHKFYDMVEAGHFDSKNNREESWQTYFEECAREWRLKKEQCPH